MLFSMAVGSGCITAYWSQDRWSKYKSAYAAKTDGANISTCGDRTDRADIFLPMEPGRMERIYFCLWSQDKWSKYISVYGARKRVSFPVAGVEMTPKINTWFH